MKKFVIEREVPGIGKSNEQELRGVCAKSNQVLSQIGAGIQWLESFVVGDKIYCVYLSEDEKLIRRHAEVSGFPANRISEVKAIIDPSTAEARA